MGRLNEERQNRLEPQRIASAIVNIRDKAGLNILHKDDKMIKFEFKDEVISYWPYSGWHSGRSITDGRGWGKLWNQIKPK